MANEARENELNLRIANQSQQIGSAAIKRLAVVSPCSTCQNYTQSNTGTPDPNRTQCPRRIWIEQSQKYPNNPQIIDPVLYLSGTSDPNTLANPVVDEATGNYLIWVATIADNSGILDSSGNIITPSILNPDFNNLYIRCQIEPYQSEQHHDILRTVGAFQEGDYVVAEEHRMSALNPLVDLTNNQVQFNDTPIAGTVSKTSLAYRFNTVNPDDHTLVPG